MEPISHEQVIQACEASDRQWRRYLRRHGQRSAITYPVPQPPIEHLMTNTGHDASACLQALLDADVGRFIVYLESGQGHITDKGRALLSRDPFYWGACCSDGGYVAPVPADVVARKERRMLERATGKALGKSRRGSRL